MAVKWLLGHQGSKWVPDARRTVKIKVQFCLDNLEESQDYVEAADGGE